jgi:hypothetical protein
MQQPKKHMAEDLLSRFRSKEDLYRYMTQQGKVCHIILTFS